MKPRESVADIGVFGGSGFYSLLEHREERRVETPYGDPSDMLHLGEIGGRRVAFLPRHGAMRRRDRARFACRYPAALCWSRRVASSGSLDQLQFFRSGPPDPA